MVRTVLISGVVIAVIVVAAVATMEMVRRRRATHAEQAADTDWVAVPVDESTDLAEEAVAQGTIAR